jgi:hypothetical protein
MRLRSGLTQEELEERVLDALRRHLAGLHKKVAQDFATASCDSELVALQADPVYSLYAFDCDEYVLIRLMGRVSIAIGRRLGEIYDKIPRFVAAARFQLTPEQVAAKFNGLELDICLQLREVRSPENRAHLTHVANQHLGKTDIGRGLGIEIRYNFNPNDNARLRKDVELGQLLQKAGLTPVYLIFSSISPRADAIARLTRAGWQFLVGQHSSAFARDLLGLDLDIILRSPLVRDEMRSEVAKIMKTMVTSNAFRRVIEKY